MTSLLSAKKRAEEFAAAVEGGADRTSLRPELAELVHVVDVLQREPEPAPRAEFTASLRERLVAEATTSLARDNVLALPPRRTGSKERRLALAASSLVLVGGTAGMAAAAQSALPGEALYPIKRGLENVQTGLSTSEAERGQDLLAQADNRLGEVQALIEGSGAVSQVPATIDDFTAQANEATELLLGEYESSGNASLIEDLRVFAADNLDELRQLARTAPAEHHDELAGAAEVLVQIDGRAEALCPECATKLETLEMPALFLAANDARDALDSAGPAEGDSSDPAMPKVAAPAPRVRDGGPAAPADGGSRTGSTGTDDSSGPAGGADGPASPKSPGDVDIDGPIGGRDLGGTVDEVTKGLLGGGGKDTDGKGTGGRDTGGKQTTEAEQLEKAIPEMIEDVTEIIIP